ncbi:MAG: hypothetical protein V2B20_07715 [Pseudomonadota bacterium]
MDNQQVLSHLVLTVTPEKLPLFTTVLQSGIEILTPAGTSIGQFLNALPGFTADYLANTVQTIFHNGTAIDNLTAEFNGEKSVLALSAAMPGLAGAIFRKNSFHAALRSDIKIAKNNHLKATTTIVKLKLFNTIALDRGKELFHLGVCLQAATLSSFLNKRPGLMQAILGIQLDGKSIDLATLWQKLPQLNTIELKILDDTTIANG